MIEWFRSGGFPMWPILVAAVFVVVAIVRSWRALRSGAAEPERARALLDGVLFWGALAAAAGVLGTLGGVAQMARVLSAARSVTPALVWGGLGVAVVNSIFGLAVLLIALIAWYLLRLRTRRAGYAL